MNPEDIEHREFFVSLGGYDRNEVDAYLAEIAAEHRALLDEIERHARETPADPIAEIGASVTAILRTANDEAEQIATDARAQADTIRSEAEDHANQLRHEAAAYADHLRREAEDEAARVRAEASLTLERAHEQAAGIVREAEAAGERIEADAERRGRERAAGRAEVEIARLAEAARRHEELRASLAEANDEISLALMAMGEPVGDARAAVQDVVLQDDDDVIDIVEVASSHEV
jgi:DivIVA domain-containing protein